MSIFKAKDKGSKAKTRNSSGSKKSNILKSVLSTRLNQLFNYKFIHNELIILKIKEDRIIKISYWNGSSHNLCYGNNLLQKSLWNMMGKSFENKAFSETLISFSTYCSKMLSKKTTKKERILKQVGYIFHLAVNMSN